MASCFVFPFLVSRVRWGNTDYEPTYWQGGCKHKDVTLPPAWNLKAENRRVFSTQVFHLMAILTSFPYKMVPWMCGHTWMLSTWQIKLRFAWNIVETKCVLDWEARGLMAFLFILATPFLLTHHFPLLAGSLPLLHWPWVLLCSLILLPKPHSFSLMEMLGK